MRLDVCDTPRLCPPPSSLSPAPARTRTGRPKAPVSELTRAASLTPPRSLSSVLSPRTNPTSTPDTSLRVPVTRSNRKRLAGARVLGGPSPAYLRASPCSPLLTTHPLHYQIIPRTPSSSPEPPELEIELELRRFGSPEFATRKRPEPPPPEAPPLRDLIAGELGHPGDQLHLHPNGDTTLSPTAPWPDLVVPCIVADCAADEGVGPEDFEDPEDFAEPGKQPFDHV
nr:extensin-like [Aegilops tauschii subsp. strangulata]